MGDNSYPQEDLYVVAYSMNYPEADWGWAEAITNADGSYTLVINYPENITDDVIIVEVADLCEEWHSEELIISSSQTSTVVDFTVCTDAYETEVDFYWEPSMWDYYTINFYDFTYPFETIISWTWDFGDGNFGEGEFAEHTYTAADEYEVTLTIEDEIYGTLTYTEMILVEEFTQGDCWADFWYWSEDFQIYKFWDFSWYYQDEVSNIDWSFGDGETESGTFSPTHTYDVDGEYIVTLTIETYSGCISTMEELIWVGSDVWYPEECEALFYTEYNPDGSLTFQDISWSGGNQIVSYFWDFGDGEYSTDASPTHTYATNDEYLVTLEIGTSSGCESSFNVFVYPGDYESTDGGILFYPAADEGKGGVRLHNVSSHNSDSWSWDYGDTKGSTKTGKGSHTHDYSVGTYVVTLTSETEEGFAMRIKVTDTDVEILQSYAITDSGTGVDEFNDFNKNNITIYPNPVSDYLNINFKEEVEKVNVSIVNIAGQIIYTNDYTNQKLTKVDLQNIQKGMYIIKINADGKETNMKFVK